MFSKAKLIRFNEEVGCAPPPNKYETAVKDKAVGGYIEKGSRWVKNQEKVPSPTAYNVVPMSPAPKTTRNFHLNVSTTSTNSANSEFLSPISAGFRRTKSARHFNYKPKLNKGSSAKEFTELKLQELEEEKATLQSKVALLEEEISKLNSQPKEVKDSSVQTEIDKSLLPTIKEKRFNDVTLELDGARERICSLEDENAHLTCKLNVFENSLTDESISLQKEKLEVLVKQREQLELSICNKDDLIAELQVQLDQIVSEARGQDSEVFKWKNDSLTVREELDKSRAELSKAQERVRDLVALYEGLTLKFDETKEHTKEVLTKKDIEIELLNASLNNISKRLNETSEKNSSAYIAKISSLENTVSELNIVSKEMEVMGSVMEDELKEYEKEVTKLEGSLEEIEGRMEAVIKDRDSLIEALEEERSRSDEFYDRLVESTHKVEHLEEQLDMARKVALDLQQEAESRLNEMLSLKAELSVKDYDLDSKDETIHTLKEEISQKMNLTVELSEKIKEFIPKNLVDKSEKRIEELETKLSEANEGLNVAAENTGQLEEKIVDLMAEISDRETDYNSRLRELEGELEELSVKYSDSLLEQDATRRALHLASENLNKEKLLLEAAERDLDDTKDKLATLTASHTILKNNLSLHSDKCNELESIIKCMESKRDELEQKLKEEEEKSNSEAVVSQLEIESLTSSNTGFMSQITQLKIDLRKKANAVDDMKVCISGLREEKHHLITLRDNLENSLERKENIIVSLKSEMDELAQNSEVTKNLEAEKILLSSQIEELTNCCDGQKDNIKVLSSKVSNLEEEIQLIRDEKANIVKSYQDQITEHKSQKEKLESFVEELELHNKTYDKKIDNLQASIDEKEAELEMFKSKFEEVNHTLETRQSDLDNLQSELSCTRVELDNLSKSLWSKDDLVSSLNATITTKSDEVKGLYKSLEDKQCSILSLEERIQYLEETEDKLAAERDVTVQQLSTLKNTLDATKEKLTRLEITHREELSMEVSRYTTEYENELSVVKEKNTTLSDEVTVWRTKFEQLEKMIEPFRDQLDAYEVERNAFASQSTAAKSELEKLSGQYANLLGHTNHKQKIQHVLKLKTENNQFREEVHKLRLELERQKKSAKRLEEKLEKQAGKSYLNESKVFTNKENISTFNHGKENTMSEPLSASTPVRSKKPHRI